MEIDKEELISSISKEIQKFTDNFKDNNIDLEKLEDHYHRLTLLEKRVLNIENKTSEDRERINRLEIDIRELKTQLEQVLARQVTLESKQDVMSGKLDNVISKMDFIEMVQDIHVSITGFKNVINTTYKVIKYIIGVGMLIGLPVFVYNSGGDIVKVLKLIGSLL